MAEGAGNRSQTPEADRRDDAHEAYGDRVYPPTQPWLSRANPGGQPGGTTAAQVIVEGRLTGENERVEMAETVLDYVPSHPSRQGGFFSARIRGNLPCNSAPRAMLSPSFLKL